MPKGVYTRTAETRKKMSEAKKGKSLRHGGSFKKGHPPYLIKHSEETKKKISLKNKGKPASAGSFKKGHKRIGNSGMPKGFKHSEGTRKKMSLAKKGEKSYLWKGGITPINREIRQSLEYKLWRESVFKRDNWTCVWCGIKNSPLNADHIKPFAYYPGLRFAIDNGRTLCVPCHQKTDTYKKRLKIKCYV